MKEIIDNYKCPNCYELLSSPPVDSGCTKHFNNKIKMKREIYVLWNKEENRPAIGHSNFGAVLAYLTLEQIQAYFKTFWNQGDKEQLEIKKLTLTDEK